ncbi:MAG: hypothetical protein ABI040_02030 [Rhodoferax sp.]
MAVFLITTLRATPVAAPDEEHSVGRKPKRTDKVTWSGYTFEALDVASDRIDRLMASRLEPAHP